MAGEPRGEEMTPCKCGSYNIYAAWDEDQLKIESLIACGECGAEARGETHEEAWDAWDELMCGAEQEPRRPVSSLYDGEKVIVFCNDGSAFWTSRKVKSWYLYDPIPGTPADRRGK